MGSQKSSLQQRGAYVQADSPQNSPQPELECIEFEALRDNMNYCHKRIENGKEVDAIVILRTVAWKVGRSTSDEKSEQLLHSIRTLIEPSSSEAFKRDMSLILNRTFEIVMNLEKITVSFHKNDE